MTSTSISAPLAHAFDPADWLQRYTALGGAYAVNGKLNLCILVKHQSDDELSQIRQMVVDLTDDQRAELLSHLTDRAAPAPEQAEPDTYTGEECEAGRKCAEEIAYLHVARAWADRWKALGGDFGLTYNNDGSVKGAHRGMICGADLWTPTDRGREDLRPHTWLTEDHHHEGAVKALEGLLELVPGLSDAVRHIASQEAYTRFGRRQEA
jgi:hypothetical protein